MLRKDIQDYNLAELTKRIQELEKRGWEAACRVRKAEQYNNQNVRSVYKITMIQKGDKPV